MKEIKEVLHLYLGCEVKHQSFVSPFVLKAVSISGIRVGGHDDGATSFSTLVENIKIILRPLSSMTEEEMKECGNLVYDFSDDEDLNRWKWSDFDFGCAEQFHWLLSKHFDLFNLIENNQALDVTTLKT